MAILRIQPQCRESYTLCDFYLPRSLSSCTSLRELDMNMKCTWKAPVISYFPNLVKLFLSYVKIMNENSTNDTLSFDFPVLKSFEMKEHQWLNVKRVAIYAPALVSFLSEKNDGEEIDSYMINIIGASLQNFETDGYYLENFLFTGSTVAYAAVKNDDDPYMDCEVVKSGLLLRRVLNESSSLKSLKLSYYLAQTLGETKSGHPLSSFYNLERLAIFSVDIYFGGSVERAIEGLFELLRSAPVLKSLSIIELYMINVIYENSYDWVMMQPVPSCVVSHLEDVEIERYSGETDEGIDLHDFYLTKSFLENGAELKKLFLRCDRPRRDADRKQLSKISVLSTSVEIIIT